MPHLTIQTTANVNIPHEASLLKALNQALWDSGHFGTPTAIKARILPIERFLVGIETENEEENQDKDEKENKNAAEDGKEAENEQENQTHGFIYAHLKLMTGRDIVARNQLAERLVTTIEDSLDTQQTGCKTLQICVEVEEISAVYQKKTLGG